MTRSKHNVSIAAWILIPALLLLPCATRLAADEKKPAPAPHVAAPRPAAPPAARPAPQVSRPAPAAQAPQQARPNFPAQRQTPQQVPNATPGARPGYQAPANGAQVPNRNFPSGRVGTPQAPNGGNPSPAARPLGAAPGGVNGAGGRQFGNNPAAVNPPAGGRQFGAPNGGAGRQFGAGARPVDRPLAGGGTAHFSPAGRVTEVRRPGLVAHQVPGGGRSVIAERPDGRRVVAYGRSGYVQRGFDYRGQRLVQRSYLVGGRQYVRVYRPYVYRGVTVNVYAPPRYYAPAFYAYAYRPWPAPIVYSAWGWGGAPWYGVYGGFFTPYPVYASPALWLTDYMIAASFQEAYEARLEARANEAAFAANNFTQPMSGDLKQQIANEVQYQLQREQEEAKTATSNQPPPQPSNLPILDSRTHILTVYTSLNVVSATAGDCTLTESDVLEFNASQPPDGPNANALVKYARQQDCPVNSVVSLPVEQLQEMNNHMLEVMEQGQSEFLKKQGQGGLPRVSSAITQTTDAPFASAIPNAEPSLEAEIQSTAKEGSAAFNDAAAVAEPAIDNQEPQDNTIRPGMTTQQVMRIMGGPPPRTANGAAGKVIFYYKDTKVTFENGVVKDVD